jgi:Secretion system C-terminal sorting domain
MSMSVHKRSSKGSYSLLVHVFCACLIILLNPGFDVLAQASVVSVSTSKTGYFPGAGDNRMIVVAEGANRATPIGTITSVTWAGQAFTKAIVENDAATTLRTEIWYLNEAGIRAAGYCVTPSNVIVTWSTAPTNEGFVVMTLKDVDQTTPIPAGASTGVGTSVASTTSILSGTGITTAGANDIVIYSSASSANTTHLPSTGYTEQSDQIIGATIGFATATKAITVGGNETPTATWAASSTIVIAGVVFNGLTAVAASPVTYYSFTSGAWDAAGSWSLSSDGSTGAANTWPGRADNVVIQSGHTITMGSVDVNKTCGQSPDGLLRANVGPFAASNLVMIYQTGDITISGTLSVTGEMMTENYTHILSGGTYTLTSSYVNLKFLDVDAGSTFHSGDDICLAGNSVTTINSSSISNDDLIISFTNATLCGSGAATLTNGSGSVLTYANGATVSQICTAFTVSCSGVGCAGSFPVTGTTVVLQGNTGPGGVGNSTNNRLWLKADDLNLANNARVTSWADASGNGLTAAANTPLTVTNQPLFKTNFVNTLPALDFNSAPGTWLTLGTPASLNFVPQTSNWSFFTAFLTPTVASGGGGTILSKTDATAARQYQYQADISNPNVLSIYIGGTFNIGTVNDAGAWTIATATTAASATGLNSYINEVADRVNTGIGISTSTADVLVGARRVTAGTTTTAGFLFTGQIGEIAMYNVVTSLAQRLIVENYLSAKYNTTLAAAVDLYTMDNAGNGNYDFDVAGIGQASDGSYHRDAKGSGVVRMWNPSSLSNNAFFFWGHDGIALKSSTTVGVDGTIIQEKLSRTWRVSENTDVGTMEISIDVSTLTGTFLGSNLRLLIDRNGNGFADNDVAPISGSFSAGVVTFSSINLQNGDRFTIGNTDKSKPLPIGLTTFKGHCQNSMVTLNWTTATEVNNDFFNVEKSADGFSWDVLATVKGAGTTSAKTTYSTIDEKPFAKLSYYRLKQVDFGGSYSYSNIVAVPIDAPDGLLVYPNPSKSTFTVLASEIINPDQVRVTNSMGQDVPFSIENSNNRLTISIGDVSQGMYVIKVKTSSGAKAIKVIKN